MIDKNHISMEILNTNRELNFIYHFFSARYHKWRNKNNIMKQRCYIFTISKIVLRLFSISASSLAKGVRSTLLPINPLADFITKTRWQAPFYNWLLLTVADPITVLININFKRKHVTVIFGKTFGGFKKRYLKKTTFFIFNKKQITYK